MHVAYIHQHFVSRKGSSGTRSYEMGLRLLKAGHRVTMITGNADRSGLGADRSAHVTEDNIDGLRVLVVNEPYSNKMSFSRRVFSFWRFANTATRLVSKLDADLVFATSTPLTVGIPGMKGARRLRVPFVFEVRDLWPELPIELGIIRDPITKWYTQNLERRIYMSSERIIALSPGIRDGIVRVGFPSERVTLIPNGCDLDLFVPSDEPLSDDRFGAPDDFRLVFTGAHGMANGLDAVVDAAAEAKRRGVKGIRFVMIGDGQFKPRLVERTRAEHLDDYILWCNSVSKPDLARILPRMDVGMQILKNLPVFYYGTSPNKFFDYIACGIPVLNNYPGWLADMIGEHSCGRAVPPDDPKAFIDAVLWMREHPEALRTMGQNARRLAEERFARDLLASQFVNTLERAHSEWHARRRGA